MRPVRWVEALVEWHEKGFSNQPLLEKEVTLINRLPIGGAAFSADKFAIRFAASFA